MERSNSMMRKKRGLDSNESEEGGNSNKKRPALASVIGESFKKDILQQLQSSVAPIIRQELRSLGPIIRQAVCEEVERALAKLDLTRLSGRSRSSPEQKNSYNERNLQLHFKTRLSLPLFSDGRVKGRQGAAVVVVLLDSDTGHVVTSGPESSAKLDVVVLEGDFKNEDDDNWTQEEFKRHVVKEREGKRPLLTGDLQVTLKEGVGILGDLAFTDNSSWIRSKMFRLGLEVASGYCEGLRIREAKTDAFNVRDRRGESYRKHYPPASNDEVWRLEKIGKDGKFHKSLNKAGIHKVKDLLRLANCNSERLRTILGSGMSNRIWEVLIEHAKTCIMSGKLYVFYADDTKNDGVVLNIVCELSGLIEVGQYYPADYLTENQKVYAGTLMKKAYDNWDHVIVYDSRALLSLEQNKQPSESVSEVPSRQQEFPTSFHHQRSLPSLSATAPPVQPFVDSGMTVGGGNDDSRANYFMDPLVNSNSHVQFDGSITLHKQLISASHEAQVTSNNVRVGLVLGPLQASSSVLRTMGTSIEPLNHTSYGYGILNEEEIHMEDQEVLESEYMQHLHPTFSINIHNHITTTEDVHLDSPGISFTSTIHSWDMEEHNWDGEDHDPRTTSYSYNEEVHCRTSGKAIVGWLKLKAALSWGIFVRKKQSDIRARLVQLDDL